MTTGEESAIGAACIQMEPKIGRKRENVARTVELIGDAHENGAQLIVLPELCNSGYVFASREEAFAQSETLESGETIGIWQELAERLRVVLVAGFAERDGDRLYNSAAILRPGRAPGRYRKLHLWGEEQLFFEAGNLGMPLFETPFGRIACAICYDIWFPETFRMASLAGADALCVPTNWVPMPAQRADLPMMANTLAMAGAHSNGMFVLAADRVGTERGQPFLGNSVIVDNLGWPVAGPAGADDEALLVARLNLAAARRNRQLNGFNHLLRDRRPDVY